MNPSTEKPTQYLRKISTLTGLHSSIDKKYKEMVGFPARTFLESPLSDGTKIALVNRFDREAGKTLETGVKYAKKIDNAKDTLFTNANNYIRPYINSSDEGKRDYEYKKRLGDFGGKKRKSRKNTRKSRKNTRKSKKHKRTRKHKY
jgi:hypothetical protein